MIAYVDMQALVVLRNLSHAMSASRYHIIRLSKFMHPYNKVEHRVAIFSGGLAVHNLPRPLLV